MQSSQAERQSLVGRAPSARLAPAAAAAQGQHPGGHAPWILHACRTLNVLTGLALLLCGFAFGIAFVLRSRLAPAEERTLWFYSGQGVRAFGVLGAAGLALVEVEWDFVQRWAPLLDVWAGRAAAQAFLATLCYREAYPRGDAAAATDVHKSLALYRGAASAALLACAATYLAGACLCVGFLRRRAERRQQRIAQAEAVLAAGGRV